ESLPCPLLLVPLELLLFGQESQIRHALLQSDLARLQLLDVLVLAKGGLALRVVLTDLLADDLARHGAALRSASDDPEESVAERRLLRRPPHAECPTLGEVRVVVATASVLRPALDGVATHESPQLLNDTHGHGEGSLQDRRREISRPHLRSVELLEALLNLLPYSRV